MPFYYLEALATGKWQTNSFPMISVAGEYIKVGLMTKPEGVGPPLHDHPHEEQFTLILKGEMQYVLDGEVRIVGPDTLIHIPRNTRHRGRPINGPCIFFEVMSPTGNSDLEQDLRTLPSEDVEPDSTPPARIPSRF